MYQQQSYNQYPNAPVNGYHYAPYNKPPKATQPLSPEDVKVLQNTGTFSLALSQQDILRSICTHKNPTTGENVLYYDQSDPTGSTVICPICGAKFPDLTGSEKDVRAAADLIINILQNIKTYYVNISEEAAKEFFPIIGLVDKIPQLWNEALKNFSRYDNVNRLAANNQPYGFNMLNAITGVGGGFNPAQQQYTQPYQQPAYPAPAMPGMYAPGAIPQPQFQPAYPQYAAGPFNPFGGYPAEAAAYQQAPQQVQQNTQAPAQQNQAAKPATQAPGAPIVSEQVLGV